MTANGNGRAEFDLFRALEGAVEPLGKTFDLADKLVHELDQPADKVIRALQKYVTQQRHGQDVDANLDFAEALLRDLRSPERRRLPFVDDGPEPEPLPTTLASQLPDVAVAYLFDDLLPLPGTSILSGAPKAGKTTLARALAVAAARGAGFLGRDFAGGAVSVLFVSLEESIAQTRAHFAQMGVRDSDPLHVYSPEGATPPDLSRRLAITVDRLRPGLVVVDTVARLLRLKDTNAYGETVEALAPVADLARATNCHVLLLHHSRKASGSEGVEVLGSTGFVGAVDTLLSLKRDESGQRTVYSRNRSGDDLPETIVKLAADGYITTAGTKLQQRVRNLEQDIIDFLSGRTEPATRDEVSKGVGGRSEDIYNALNGLVGDGRADRMGSGRRGQPFTYRLRSS